MHLRYFNFALVSLALLLASCSSTKKPETAVTPTANVAAPTAAADSATATAVAEEEPLPEGNKDIAHESFLRYLYLQQRGEAELALVFLQHASESDPANRYLSFALAEELSEREQYELAMKAAERGKKLPGKPNAAEDGLLASLYLRTGKLDSAKAYYKRAISENEEDYTKIYEYSLFLEWEELKDFDELLRVYSILLPRVNYMRSMFNRTAQIMLQNGKDTSFCRLLTDAFNATHDASFMMDKFRFFEEKKQKDSAFVTLQNLHKELPNDTMALKIYSATLVAEGKSPEAAAIIAEYRSNNEAAPSIIYVQGLAARGENKLDSAVKYFNEILNDPKFGHQAHAQLSFIAVAKEDTATAVREIEIADSLAPGEYFIDRLRRYMTYDMAEKAFPMLDTLMAREHDLMQSETAAVEEKNGAKDRYYGLLSVYADMHVRYASKRMFSEPDTAQAHYKMANDAVDLVLLNDPNVASAKFLRASILERRHKPDEAVAAFRAILKEDPKNHLVMNYLGYTFVDLARTPEEVNEGVALIDAALSYAPDDVSYLDSKAWGLFRLGKLNEAKELMVSLPLKQENILQDYSYWEHLGRILDALGERAAAEDCFDKLYEIMPAHPFAKKKAK